MSHVWVLKVTNLQAGSAGRARTLTSQRLSLGFSLGPSSLEGSNRSASDTTSIETDTQCLRRYGS